MAIAGKLQIGLLRSDDLVAEHEEEACVPVLIVSRVGNINPADACGMCEMLPLWRLLGCVKIGRSPPPKWWVGFLWIHSFSSKQKKGYPLKQTGARCLQPGVGRSDALAPQRPGPGRCHGSAGLRRSNVQTLRSASCLRQ